MRYRQLDSSGDMTFGQGSKNFLTDTPAAVAQAVSTALKLVLGEWYLDLNAGVPYLEGVVGKHSKETADLTLVSQINLVQGVSGIANWVSTIDPNTRKYSSISATLYTIYGVTQLQLVNLGNF